MYKNEREQEILKILQTEKFASVKHLSDVLFTSESSIRRDLSAMESKGIVKRSYGGVELVEKSNHLPPLPQRQIYMQKEKRRLACAAIEGIFMTRV